MIAAIYSRKSIYTGKGDSIENQIQICKDYAINHLKDKNIEDFIIYEDEGYSGKNLNRPNFKKLLLDGKSKKFQILICYKLDRISRNVADFSKTLELLQSYSIDFISIKEQFDTSTPIGRAMIYIASVFAQLERETIAERVKDNMLELSKSGRWLGGQTPLGYKSEKVSYLDENFKERSFYKLIPIDYEINLVKKIFEKYLKYKSLRKVNQWLLENNYKTKLGANWNVRAISDLLKSPTYVMADEKVINFLKNNNISCIGTPNSKHGILTFNKKKGKNIYRDKSLWIASIANHDGIISSNSWLKVQEILTKNKSKSPRLGKTNNVLLSGILKCGVCGSPMGVIHGKKDIHGNKNFYYSCRLKNYSKGTRCTNGNINSKDLERAILNFLKDISVDSNKIIKKINRTNYNLNKEDIQLKEIEFLKKSLEKNLSLIKNLVRELALNSNSKANKYIISEIENLENENENLKKNISNLSSNNGKKNKYNEDIKISPLKDFNKNFFKNIRLLNNDEKKHIISRIISKITWTSKESLIHIYLYNEDSK
ncbi:recombinase family protein [Clostridium fallax]|uniref:Site-specific DNA recombinase n=1 Tax=Clostridium fallax TaxID=1533 RepID=A0A1M4XKP3_9CLOT|nr:recombinase family protein [Clostridium fallax]SHE94001.1 site-specific DNA recombinase [Clostridium fallax]SQB06366.1 site-specific recombinase [Clostridium fallax]